MAFERSEMVELTTAEVGSSIAHNQGLIPPQTVASVAQTQPQTAVPQPSSRVIETDAFLETYKILWSTFERFAAKWGTSSVLVIWPAEWQQYTTEAEQLPNFSFTGDDGLLKVLAYENGILVESFETPAPQPAI